MPHIAVVGAGQAGASLVAKLRSLGFDGDITLFGDEPVPPYQRPPLSKKYLMGEMPLERLFLKPAQFYDEAGITLRTGTVVDHLDIAAREVVLGEERIAYDQAALTTGLVPRPLPADRGGALKGVYVVRNLADVDALAVPFDTPGHMLVVGGGYIGLEAAAVAAMRGFRVTIVEIADRILERVAAPETADVFRALHTAHGVDVREGAGLDRLLGEEHVTGARLTNGEELEVDIVVVGIGLIPRCAIAERSGLATENGIRVDAYGQSSDPTVWAAGDCASFPWRGRRIRLESVQNAIDMGEAVAENMLGAHKIYEPHPWFWSDQYDAKLQIAGLNTGYDHLVVRPGAKDGAVSHWYYRGDQLIAVDAINDGRAYMVGKRLIESGKSPAREDIGNPSVDLKPLLKA